MKNSNYTYLELAPKRMKKSNLALAYRPPKGHPPLIEYFEGSFNDK